MAKNYRAPKGNSYIVAAETLTDEVKMPKELTERQQRIVKFRQRGLTQKAIAEIENVSQPMIAKEVRKIREVFAAQGSQIDQDVVVGESLNLFQEVEHRAWSIYSKSIDSNALGDANKALNTIMSARERSTKLLMDLGLVKRAAVEHHHEVAPFLEKWEKQSKEDKRLVVESVIDTQLSALPAPAPPEEPEDAEWEAIEDEESEEGSE